MATITFEHDVEPYTAEKEDTFIGKVCNMLDGNTYIRQRLSQAGFVYMSEKEFKRKVQQNNLITGSTSCTWRTATR